MGGLDKPATESELGELESVVESWLADALASNPVVVAVERDESGARRWFLRVNGEDKDVYSIWFTLGQRTLHAETYFMPAPEENAEACYAHLLRRNTSLYGLAFCIGAEDAVFLAGQLGNASVNHDELDRLLGTFYATVEQCFRPALRIGFASRFG